MKTRFVPALLMLLCMASSFTLIGLQDWTVTPDYTIRFTNPEVSGRMTKFKADISFDPKNLRSSKFDVHIDAASVNTGNQEMDAQAMGPELLDARTYTEIRFQASGVTTTPEGFQATGILDLHGVKKEISIAFTFENKVFKGGFAFKCKDYGMNGLGKEDADILRIELIVPVTQK